MAGTVYLVGAGPGDVGLLTLRGKELLERADLVVYDHLASQRLLDFVPANAQRIYVGKKAADHTLAQEEINQLLVSKAREGLTVVRLKGGDPYVFGRGGEEALALVEAGIEFEVVPGVTSGIAAAAYAGIPVTHRHMASCFGVVTGHEAPGKADSNLDYAALARWSGTLAFYMGMGNLLLICKELVSGGRPASTPAAVIRWGATPRQQVVTGTLEDLPRAVAAAGLGPPVLIVVGQVVSMRDKLNWYEKKPLFGKRVIVTRARAQASELVAQLHELGAEVIELPTIRIQKAADLGPLRTAIGHLEDYDWIIFTSANGVDAFFGELREMGLDSRALGRCKIAAIGPTTAGALDKYNIRPDLQPARFISSAIVEALAATGELPGKRILCPRSNIAPKDMVEAFQAAGAAVDDVAAYQTVADNSNSEVVREMLQEGRVDWITFTSSSTVENFFAVIAPDVLRRCGPKVASIGPSTSQTVRKVGFEVTAEAVNSTIPALVKSIMEAESVASPRERR